MSLFHLCCEKSWGTSACSRRHLLGERVGSGADPARAGGRVLGYAEQGLQGAAYICCYGHVGDAGEEILPKPGAAWPGMQRCPLQGQTVPRAARSMPGVRRDPRSLLWVTLLHLQPNLCPGANPGRSPRGAGMAGEGGFDMSAPDWHEDGPARWVDTGSSSLFGAKRLEMGGMELPEALGSRG